CRAVQDSSSRPGAGVTTLSAISTPRVPSCARHTSPCPPAPSLSTSVYRVSSFLPLMIATASVITQFGSRQPVSFNARERARRAASAAWALPAKAPPVRELLRHRFPPDTVRAAACAIPDIVPRRSPSASEFALPRRLPVEPLRP